MAEPVLKKRKEKLAKELNKGLRKVADLVEDRIRNNISLSDHTQRELDELNNPYGRTKPKQIHRPGFKVHTQQGDLLKALGQVEKDGKINIGVDPTIAPHAPGIIMGTARMVARDFISGTFNQVGVQRDIRKIIERAIKRGSK